MNLIAQLTSRALLRLEGSDVLGFLQNLITNDVENLDDGQARFGALLTPQGKVLFDFIVRREGDGYILDVERVQRDALAKRLSFYKLRADVQISNDDRNVFAGWADPSSPSSSSAPETGFADPRHAGLGWRVYADDLKVNSDEHEWHRNRIALGVPQSGMDFELESVFPHDALMDQMEEGGIDFSKGCYVGQEVVSRMQHRGTARNRFVIVSSSGALPDNVLGQNIVAGGRRIGTMGSHIDNKGLALVRIDRVGAVLKSGTPVLLENVALEVKIPEFVNYEWSQ